MSITAEELREVAESILLEFGVRRGTADANKVLAAARRIEELERENARLRAVANAAREVDAAWHKRIIHSCHGDNLNNLHNALGDLTAALTPTQQKAGDDGE